MVLHPPRFGATAARVDDQAALAGAGVTAVVPIDEGVAVIVETFADAQRGLHALVVEWDDTKAERRSSAELLAEHVRLVQSGENAVTSRDDGDVDRALVEAAFTVDATYTLPYLADAPMEPNNAVCRMRDDGMLDVWVATEAPEYVKMNASTIAGIDKEQVEVHVTFAGGSFGLHSTAEHDPTSEAVQIARALDWKHPIKVQSLREEEFKVGRYRSMAVHRVRAGADTEGRLTAWHQQIVAKPTSVNLPFVRDVMFTNGVDFFTTTSAVNPPYAVENFRLESTNFESPITTMVWRSVGNSHTEFARVGDRRARHRDGPRPRRPATKVVGRKPANLTGPRARRGTRSTGKRRYLKAGRGGITSSDFLGYSAQVTEVSLDRRERVHVDRIVFALDCGIQVNPDLIRAQLESGLLWGLSAAAWGEVVLGEGGQIVTQNFDTYPVVRMRSVPQIEVHLIDSTEPPNGIGEISVPSVAPRWRTPSPHSPGPGSALCPSRRPSRSTKGSRRN